jgi:tetratricopeptide (TPR) repeat protein
MASGPTAKERYAAEKAAPLLARAFSAYKAGDVTTAGRLVDAALRFQPNASSGLVLRATIAFERGDYAVAVGGFRKVLTLQLDDRETASNLAVALSRLGDYAECHEILRAHAPWDDYPDNELLLVQSALASGSGTDDEIAGRIAALEAKRPNDVTVAFLRGIMEERRARLSESLSAFARAAELSHDAVGLSELLRVTLRVGQEDALEALVERAWRRLTTAPDDALSVTLAALEVRLEHGSQPEERVFTQRESNAQPSISWNSRIDRLIVHQDFAGAVEMLATSVPQVLPPPVHASAAHRNESARDPVTRIVVHNGHQVLRHASADDLTEACGLPVRLLDLGHVLPADFAAGNTLVVYACGITGQQGQIVRTIKSASADCPVVAWHFDNHHCYLWNALLVAASDLSFPAHVTPIDYLPRWSPRGACGGVVPLCVMQWTRPLLARLYDEYRTEPRSDALSGNFEFYPIAAKRNHFVAEVNRRWPDAEIAISLGGYHHRSARDRFLTWRRYKTSVSLPVAGDLSNRFFDALAAGQVPVVPRDILDFDRVVPPALQSSLPVIRLEEYSVEALRAAHAAAIAAFDRGDEAQAELRHRFVLEHHMLAHRIREIAERSADQLGFPLRGAHS